MAQAPITTIPPFSDAAQLPDCAKSCGPLYDANGACVPPAAPQAEAAAYTACFCADSRVAAFSRGSAGVCDNACAGNQAGLQSIANWFQGICRPQKQPGGNNGAPTATGANQNPQPTDSAASASSSNTNSGGGDWLSNHWKWVIMLVVLVVGIAAIWIGACIWRRRYIRKRDRQTIPPANQQQSDSNPSWGPPDSTTTTSGGILARDPERDVVEKPPTKEKKKWTITERT
ncbi:hypothetical protein CDD82_7638 [Ophiocordyceps australis]|uniref:Integral membrane protein n=1 Tax=Ophiocordyceps australis TaxID=1399860 RepID=A0A2C5ZPX2_9HYPO|nr:hypothetical protein CDD82_7638 [Ophiocordyceps australis]